MFIQINLTHFSLDLSKKLQRNATAAHVANRLEVIYLMERLIMWDVTLHMLDVLKVKGLVIEQLSVQKFDFSKTSQ